MEKKGNLRDYVEITDRGREYLKLREQAETSHPSMSQLNSTNE